MTLPAPDQPQRKSTTGTSKATFPSHPPLFWTPTPSKTHQMLRCSTHLQTSKRSLSSTSLMETLLWTIAQKQSISLQHSPSCFHGELQNIWTSGESQSFLSRNR